MAAVSSTVRKYLNKYFITIAVPGCVGYFVYTDQKRTIAYKAKKLARKEEAERKAQQLAKNKKTERKEGGTITSQDDRRKSS